MNESTKLYIEKIYQLYTRNNYSVLSRLFDEGDRSPILISMLSGYALRNDNNQLAAKYIDLITNTEELRLKQQTLQWMQSASTATNNEPRVHLLILTYNREKYIKNALAQLGATDYKNYAVYILDNGSTDQTWPIVQTAQQFFPADIPVHIEQMPFNVGRPLGHNMLLTKHDHSAAEFIAIGDDDLLKVPTNWLRKMVATAQRFPNAAVVGGKALSPGMHKTIHGGVRKLLHYTSSGMSMTGDNEEADYGQYDYLDFVDHVIGCLHIYRSSMLFNDIGLFDIRYSPCQCVDIDHHLRTRLKGYDIVYNGLVEFIHARAMGNEARTDKSLQGNALGNLIKLLSKFDEKAINTLIAKHA